MSLQHDAPTSRKNVVSLRAGGFTFAMRQMFAPLVQQVSAGHHARKIAQARRATEREIANLPVRVRQDLGLVDGAVIGQEGARAVNSSDNQIQ